MTDPLNSQMAALLLAQQRGNQPADRSRRFAQILMQQKPMQVQSPLEGLARALQEGVEGVAVGLEDRRAQTRDRNTIKGLSDYSAAPAGPGGDEARRTAQALLGEGDPTMVAPFLMQKISDQREATQRGQHADAFTAGFGKVTNPPAGGAPPTAVAQGGDAPLPGIPAFESGGRYDAVGPVANNKGQRAYGKYQVMDFNVGPWTQEVLGTPMTPQEFLANPQAQDAVYKAKIGQYRQQTGSDQGAASMWFSGQPNPNANLPPDVNGTTVPQYVQRTTGGVQTPSNISPNPAPVAQGDTQPRADASGTPVPPTSAVPDVPRPQPSPQQVEKYTGMIRDGSMTAAQARTALDQELTQEWTVQRENRRMQWQQQQEDQRVQKKAQIDLEQKAPMELISKRMDNYENKVRPATMAAINEIPIIHQARQVLDAGAFTGTGAEAKTLLAKIGEQLNIPSQDAQNTQVLGSVLAKRTLAASGGTLGTGFSNADRDFMEQASGGKITLDEGAIRHILDIGERQARQLIAQHDTETKRMAKLPGVAQLGPDYLALPQAPTYQEWSKANPPLTPQGAPPPPQAGAPDASQGAPPPDLLKEGVGTRFENGQVWTLRGGKPERVR